jgi:RES domain
MCLILRESSGFDPVPFTTYFADAKLPFLDVTEPETLNALGLAPADLHTPWRLSPAPTKTQILGAAVAKQTRFAAIRYPSDAAEAEGKAGCNFVIFRDSIEAPASLRVLTGNLVAVQQWP